MSGSEKSEEVTLEVTVEVPGNAYAIVKQAVGYCDGSTVKTLMIKIEELDFHGNFIREYIVDHDE